MDTDRFERQIRLFGKAGQQQIESTRVAVIGAGGLGSHVIQQLAFLGVGCLTIVDREDLETSNLNRLVGARHDDPVPGTKKVSIARRMVHSINESIRVNAVPTDLRTREAFCEIKKSKYLFGCLDNDGSRLVLNELCSAFEIPYLDLASDIVKDRDGLHYGGRVFVNYDNNGCLSCRNLISASEAALELESSNARKDRESIYGVAGMYLGETGPSVVSINGVVASLAVTEFMVMVIGLRSPNRLLNYRGSRGIVNENKDGPNPDCYYCKSIRGKGDSTEIDRYCKSTKK